MTIEQLLEHPVAKKKEWIERMLWEVYALKSVIHEKVRNENHEGSRKSEDFSMSLRTSEDSSAAMTL